MDATALGLTATNALGHYGCNRGEEGVADEGAERFSGLHVEAGYEDPAITREK